MVATAQQQAAAHDSLVHGADSLGHPAARLVLDRHQDLHPVQSEGLEGVVQQQVGRTGGVALADGVGGEPVPEIGDPVQVVDVVESGVPTSRSSDITTNAWASGSISRRAQASASTTP